MKIRDAIKLVENDGWLTIAGHPSMDLDPKTQSSILKQAGLK